MYDITRLKNGVRVVTHPMKQRESISLGIWVGVGGRHEADSIKGIAHFLEHIAFKGSKKYSCDEIKQKVEGVGGSLNAFTGEEQTCYYAKIPAAHIKQTFDVLSDITLYPQMKAEDIEKERTVILEEIKMYHDLPQYYVMDLLDQLMWPKHPLGKGIIGSAETVGKMSRHDLTGFHGKFYSPRNIVIAACGNCDHKSIVKLVHDRFGDLKPQAQAEFEPFKATQSQPKVAFHRRPIEQMHLALGMLGYDQSHKDRYSLGLLNIILGGNMSSRLFVEVRENKGLAYSIHSNTKILHDTGMFMIRAGVDNAKLLKAIEIVLKELKKIKSEGVSAGEFKRAKDYLSGQLLVGLEDTMEHMLWAGESLVTKNEVKTLKNVIAIFDKIQRKDIKRVAEEVLDEKKFNLAVVGPLEDRQEKDIRALLNLSV